METTSSKLFWFFIALCYCLTAPACRVMKKNRLKDRSETVIHERVNERRDLSLIDSSRKDSKEVITYDFTFRDFDKIPESDRSIANPTDQEITALIRTTQVEQLLDRVSNLKVKVVREQSEQTAIRKQETEDKETEKKEDIKTQKTTLDKESDSTWAANVPWYGWIIGAALIFGIVWYLINRSKPV